MLNRRHLITATVGAMASGQVMAAQNKSLPLIIAHRGASGYVPEHTLEAYDMAIKMGADYIEPDLVSTKDGHLIIRHDPVLIDSTDIETHPEFADRKRTVKFQGFELTDYFTVDFTLDEIKTLKARQVFKDRKHDQDDRFEIATLAEMIELVQSRSKQTGRVIGIYPETKFPSLHQSLGLGMEDKLIDQLSRAGWNKATSPVFIQSFEQANLKYLRTKTKLRLVQLISGSGTDPVTGAVTLKAPDDRPYDWVLSGRTGTYADLLTPEGLDEVATYADVIAPWKRHLISFANGQPIFNRSLVDNAHARGLKVHTWTLRDDRLEAYYQGDPTLEFAQVFDLGIDGVFTDFADTGIKARQAWAAKTNR
jgi:glycerophosphoryl diester phosphodiesterase